MGDEVGDVLVIGHNPGVRRRGVNPNTIVPEFNIGTISWVTLPIRRSGNREYNDGGQTNCSFDGHGVDAVACQLLPSFFTGFYVADFIIGKGAKVTCQPPSHFSAGSKKRYIHWGSFFGSEIADHSTSAG